MYNVLFVFQEPPPFNYNNGRQEVFDYMHGAENNLAQVSHESEQWNYQVSSNILPTESYGQLRKTACRKLKYTGKNAFGMFNKVNCPKTAN